MTELTSVTISLNRAHKVSKRMGLLLTTIRGKLTENLSINISNDKAGQRALDVADLRAAVANECLNDCSALLESMTALRNQVASKNAELGIAQRLGEDFAIGEQIQILEASLRVANYSVPNSEVVQRLAEGLALQQQLMHAGLNGVSANDLNLDRQWTMLTLSANDVERWTALLNGLRAKRVRLADEISDANATKISVTLPSKFLGDLLGS